MYGPCYCMSRMGWQQRSKCLGSKSKTAHIVALPYWYPAFLQQTQLSIELLLNIFHSSCAVYILWIHVEFSLFHRHDELPQDRHGYGSRAILSVAYYRNHWTVSTLEKTIDCIWILGLLTWAFGAARLVTWHYVLFANRPRLFESRLK